MTTEEGAISSYGAFGAAQVLSTFWGLALLLGLAAYTLIQTMSDEPASAGISSPGPSRLPSTAAITSISMSGPYPAIQAEPMVILLACDQEDASFDRISNRPPPGRYPFTMRLDQVPNDIRAVLDGTDTVFPKDARIVKTPCIQGMIDAGTLP